MASHQLQCVILHVLQSLLCLHLLHNGGIPAAEESDGEPQAERAIEPDRLKHCHHGDETLQHWGVLRVPEREISSLET